jgi:CheY-like chemotaxis protein
VARALRGDPELAPALLVAVTGYGQPRDQQLSLEAGFDAHLTKPIDVSDLEEVLLALRGSRDTPAARSGN